MQDRAQRQDGRTTDTRARIQAAALQLFTQRGFQNTSLREIADLLGVTKAALYYHFPSKAELVRSLLQPFIDDVDTFLDDVETRNLEPRAFFEEYFEMLLPHRRLSMALLRDATAFAYVDIEAAVVRWVDRVQTLLTGPNATVTQRIRAVAAVSGLARCVVMTEFPIEDLRAAAIDAACAALGVEEQRTVRADSSESSVQRDEFGGF